MTSKTTTGALWDAVQWRARIFWQGWTGCWMILPRGSSMQTDVMFTLNGGHWRSLKFCHDKKHLCIVNVRKPPFCYLLATEGCPSVWLIPHHGTLVLVMSHLQTIIFSWQMGKMATSYNGLKCNIFLCLFHYPSSNVKILCLCQLRTQHVATNMLDF